MDSLPYELSLRIFCLLDYHHLAAAQQVCKDWNGLGNQDYLWCNLFIKRWGEKQANFFSPSHPKTWKMSYETQDRCDRVGLGLTITREGNDYYIVYQGQIQRFLGSKQKSDIQTDAEAGDTWKFSTLNKKRKSNANISVTTELPQPGLLDKILFFVGDLEAATMQAKKIATE